MYTRCPKCQALYPLEAKDLRAGRGEVQCDRCHVLFSALGALADSPEQAHADPNAVVRIPTLGRGTPSTADSAGKGTRPDDGPASTAPSTALPVDAFLSGLRAEPRFQEALVIPRGRGGFQEALVTPLGRGGFQEALVIPRGRGGFQEALVIPRGRGGFAASFEPADSGADEFQEVPANAGVHLPGKPASPVFSFWLIAVLAAAAALCLQALIFESERLARRPGWRPWVERLCPLFDCPVPAYRDLAQIQIVERSLTPAHGGVDGQEFRAVLANYAERPQPYPRLKLTLNQYNGEPIAQRIFTPQQYLETAGSGLMPIAAVVTIHLLIANPGKDVGGFSIELL
ncbi:MAG: DUF3426 domain-containing protein [Methylococcaceae bacterium]|nr:MAG: DUF3426 domain-containing protein [Methylococcaceae bacterium]